MKHIDEDSKTNSIAKFRIGETVRICGPKINYGDDVGKSVVITKCNPRGNSFVYAIVGIGWTAWHDEEDLEAIPLNKMDIPEQWKNLKPLNKGETQFLGITYHYADGTKKFIPNEMD